MKIRIIEDKHNVLLKRKEIIAHIDYEGATPSKAQIQEALAHEHKFDKEKIEVSKILSEIGKPVGKAWIKVWEIKPPEKKKKAKKGEKKEEQKPKEEKPVEKPKEEKK
jgi:ribosomal protein S24E